MGYKITIDGPSSTGKGYVAREVSKKLGILNIDTGAMYRAFALYCIDNKVDLNNKEDVKSALEKAIITFEHTDSSMKVFLNNKDVSSEIRTEQVAMFASKVSAIISVREEMVKRQREIGSFTNFLMEGRDIGSVVFPQADVKIYLTATLEVRASRRYNELVLKNKNITFKEVLDDIQRRDEADINKGVSPLIKTKDMIEIDTTNMSKDQVVDKVIEIIKQKGLIGFD